jgi:hypothetical protein
MADFNEADWKHLARLKKVMLNRLCNRILDELHEESAPAKRGEDAHEQYLRVYKLMEKWDDVIAVCFNDWRRSRAFQNLLFQIQHQVITKEEIAGLSEETRKKLDLYNDLIYNSVE